MPHIERHHAIGLEEKKKKQLIICEIGKIFPEEVT